MASFARLIMLAAPHKRCLVLYSRALVASPVGQLFSFFFSSASHNPDTQLHHYHHHQEFQQLTLANRYGRRKSCGKYDIWLSIDQE